MHIYDYANKMTPPLTLLGLIIFSVFSKIPASLSTEHNFGVISELPWQCANFLPLFIGGRMYNMSVKHYTEVAFRSVIDFRECAKCRKLIQLSIHLRV